MSSVVEDNKKQYNIHAHDWQKQMETNVGHKYLEKPAMKKQLPGDLSEKDVLCVGVGVGDEIKDIQARDPNNIVGIDISEKLLEIAKQNHPSVEFKQLNMMKVGEEFPKESFDFVYSSLAFHYSKDWDVLLEQIYNILCPDGMILISTHHPDYWDKNPTGDKYTNKRGVTLTEHKVVLPGGVKVTYYNHPNTQSINKAFEHSGFTVLQGFAPEVLDIKDAGDLQDDYEALKAKNKKTPLFYIVKAVK